ncbi:MAG: YdjY domain-containing protein [Candidatus Thermochlorobacter sp.]
MSRISAMLGVIYSCTVIMASAFAQERSDRQVAMPNNPALIVDTLTKTLTLSGRIYPSKFNAWTSWTKHHHFIVWKKGRAAHNALIETDANDEEILDALLSIGAVPGNNLTADTWEKRAELSSPEPDKRVEGSLIDVSVAWQGQSPIGAAEIFEDEFGKGFLFRFGGHRKLIPIWKSGCVVCLQSCPGGRISNANYTMRDYYYARSKFEVKKARLPKDGTPVQVRLKLCEE